jgi:hypothetical protein
MPNLPKTPKQMSMRCKGGGMSEAVNHPRHYTSHPSGIEAIEVTRHMNFNTGNAIKYLWRAGIKNEDAHIQDLEKALFYVKDEIRRLQQDKLITK